MSRQGLVLVVFWACISVQASFAQVPAKVDFRTEVLPLLKQHCIGCHGSTQQMNGFRLDRRQSALRGGTGVVLIPGNSAVSRLYLKVAGTGFGMQMPPTGPLGAEQIRIIKDWIDQGVEWPDELAGDLPVAPPDPKATRIMETLRAGDTKSFKRLLAESPQVVNLKGPGGSTPLMYAALYGDSDSVRLLLDRGADPNIRNHDGASALMWAVHDTTKTRLLLERGAEVDVRSDDGRTPLIIAAGRHGSSAVVRLLLDHGAKPTAKAADGTTALQQAAQAGDDGVMRLLVDRGADTKDVGPFALISALVSGCTKCSDMLIKSSNKQNLSVALSFIGPFGDAAAVKMLLDNGADPNGLGFEGATAFTRAAHSDFASGEVLQSLIARGANLNAKSPKGGTALDFAKLRGETPVTALLVKAGAQPGTPLSAPAAKSKPAASARAAVERSLPLLQSSDVTFVKKSGCVSCHNNNLTAMTVSIARKNRLTVDETIARQQLKTIGSYLDNWRERVLRDHGIPGDADTVSYILVGLAAENYPPDATTDAMAHFLKTRQAPDGRWRILIHRPPIESSDITVTATSLRALRVYGVKSQRAGYEKAIEAAAKWLTLAQPRTTEERAFQLLGLLWASASKDAIQKASRALLAEQRPDGGWSQIPTLPSDAYGTGQALVALREAAGLPVTDPAYQRGLRFLIDTQLEDGSWYVRSRSMPFQPFFESGFPHGHDQWISAAASNWATMALSLAAQ